MNRGIHETPIGATIEWYTPPELFRSLAMTFDLDPASPGADVVPWVPAARHYTAGDNGLIQPWAGRVWRLIPHPATFRTTVRAFVGPRAAEFGQVVRSERAAVAALNVRKAT